MSDLPQNAPETETANPLRYDDSLVAARVNGYTWPEIDDHLSTASAVATDQGYAPQEIDQFLGRGSPENGQQRMENEWRKRLAQDEDAAKVIAEARVDAPITPLESPTASRIAQYAGTDAPEPAMPGPDFKAPLSGLDLDDKGARLSYRDALNAGEVRTPQDFAERYVGAAWSAADAKGLDPDPHALTRAAGELAAQLPSNEELTDQAIQIATQTGGPDVSTIKNNIVNEWTDGVPLPQIAKGAATDPYYAQSLTRDDTPPSVLGDLVSALKDVGVGIVKGFAYPDEEFQTRYNTHQEKIREALRQGPPPGAMEQFAATLTRAITDTGAGVIDAFLQQPETFRKVLAGEGVTPEEALTTATLMASGPLVRGYGPRVIEPEILPPLPRARITGPEPGLPGGTGPIIEGGGVTPYRGEPYVPGQAEPYQPGQTIRLPPVPDMPVIDLERPIGEPPRLIAPREALGPIPPEITAAHQVAQELSALPVATREAALKGAPPQILEQAAPATPRTDEISLRGPVERSAQVEAISPAQAMRAADLAIEQTDERTLPGQSFFQRILEERVSRGELTPQEALRVPEPAPQELLDLAEGYDTAKSLYQHFYGLVGDVLKDETGASTIGAALGAVGLRWRTPADQAYHDAFSQSRDIAHRILIPSLMRGVKNDVQLAGMMDTYRGLIAPHVNEFARASRRSDGPAMMASEIGKLYEHYETGQWSTLANSKLAPMFDAMMAIAKHGEAEMIRAFNEGLIDRPYVMDNWFKHLWKDPRGPRWDSLMSGPGGRRQGDATFTEQRHLPRMSDGLKLGMSPMFDNPIDQMLYGEHLRSYYLNALGAVKEAIGEGQAYWATAPNDPSDIRLDGVAARNAKGGGGIFENLYARPGFARPYNNALRTGMNEHPVSASAYNRLLWIGNATTALKLLWPGFHMRVVGLASWGHAFANSFEQAGRGQFLKAMGTAATLPTVFGPAARDIWVGFRSVYRYTHGINDPVVDLLNEAGLRMTPRQAIYRTGGESLLKTAAHGGFQPLQGRWNVAGGVAEIVREIGRDIRDAGGDPRLEGNLQRVFRSLYRVPVGLPLKELGRVMMTATAPFFDYLVPAMKTGANYNRLKSYLDANPFATPEEKWFAARQIVRSIENNMGELNQDTLFGPRMAKQIANASLVSTGWKYGSYRGFLGWIWDFERGGRWTGKVAFNGAFFLPMIGMVAGYMFINTIQQTLEYGQPPPWSTNTPFMDIINHRTGGAALHGEPARGMDPAELKEIYDLAKVVLTSVYSPKDGAVAAADYVLGAFNPFWKVIQGTIAGHALHKTKSGRIVDMSVQDRPGGYWGFVRETLGPIVWGNLEGQRPGSKLNPFDAFMGGKEASGWVTDFNAYIQRLDKFHQYQMKKEKAAEDKTTVGASGAGRQPRATRATGGGGPGSPNWGR